LDVTSNKGFLQLSGSRMMHVLITLL